MATIFPRPANWRLAVLPLDKAMVAPHAVAGGKARTHDADAVRRGIFWMIAASFFFAFTGALAKWQVASYPVGEVMALRAISTLFVVALFTLPQAGLRVYATKRPGSHIARGLSQSISQTFTVLAFSLMPLAGAMSINFSAPIWAALFSALMLRERTGPIRWIALGIGFAGVLVVAGPSSSSFQLGALFALANAVMYGSVTVAVRSMTSTESTNCLLMWQVTIVAIGQSLLLVFGFRTPGLIDALLFLLSGVTNAFAQLGWTKALGLAPTAAVSPFYYFTLIWAILFGFLIWSDIPTVGLIVGSGIIVLSGLMLLVYETRRRPTAA
jgi:drug/metabolite transporter (DMT)-like permease